MARHLKGHLVSCLTVSGCHTSDDVTSTTLGLLLLTEVDSQSMHRVEGLQVSAKGVGEGHAHEAQCYEKAHFRFDFVVKKEGDRGSWGVSPVC